MSFVVNFLLLVEKVEKFAKKDIDEGKTPPYMYDICCCVREAFCLSYAIRKDNNVFVCFIEDQIFIKLVGRELRFLGSDERSQVLLILRALNEITQRKSENKRDWKRTTPGIYAKILENFTFFNDSINAINDQLFAFIEFGIQSREKLANFDVKEFDFASDIKNIFYILPIFDLTGKMRDFALSLKTNGRIKFFTVSNIRTVRDGILWINYQIDRLDAIRGEAQP